MRRRRVTVVALFIAMLVLLPATARAHTEVQRATPGPGEVVADDVDRIELQFLDPVLPRVEITVLAPSGDPVPGLGAVSHSDDGRRATVEFDALRDAGDFVVDFDFVSLDGDAQSDTYRFTIDPAGDDSGWRGVAAVAAAVVVLIGALVLALRRRRDTAA